MMAKLGPLNGTIRRAMAAAFLLAVSVTGCAGGGPRATSGDNLLNGSGSSVPAAPAIDYHGFPYNLQSG
jgi:hypothetical protein